MPPIDRKTEPGHGWHALFVLILFYPYPDYKNLMPRRPYLPDNSLISSSYSGAAEIGNQNQPRIRVAVACPLSPAPDASPQSARRMGWMMRGMHNLNTAKSRSRQFFLRTVAPIALEPIPASHAKYDFPDVLRINCHCFSSHQRCPLPHSSSLSFCL